MESKAARNATRPKYRVIIELEAPIERAFKAASAQEAMMQWVPGVKGIDYDHSQASEPYGAGSKRWVSMPGGNKLLEVIDVSDSPTLLTYHIPSLGTVGDRLIAGYRGRMCFEPLGARRTRLTWEGYFECTGLQRLAQPLISFALMKMITTMAHNINRYLLQQRASPAS